MFRIILNRLRGRPGLTALSVLAVALAVGLTASVPIFAQAVNRAILEEELSGLRADLNRSPLAVRAYYLPKSAEPFTSSQALATLDYLRDVYTRNTALPAVRSQVAISSAALLLKTNAPSQYGPAGTFLANASIGFLSDVDQHVHIVDGDAWGAVSQGGVLNVWMHDSFAAELGLHPGETYVLQPIALPSAIQVRIAGLWSPTDPNEAYWPASPNSTYRSLLLVHGDEYASLVEPLLGTMPTSSIHWALDLDEGHFVPELAGRYLEGLKRSAAQAQQLVPGVEINVAAETALADYLERLKPLTLLLTGFSVPIIGFVLYFLALVSAIAADSERQVAAVMVSRGASDQQILLLALIEGGLLVLVGTPVGIGLGLIVARLMGYTTSFLRFGALSPLHVSLAGLNYGLIAATIFVALLARVYPHLSHRGQTVIAHANEVGRQLRPPFWQRYYLDVLMLLPTGYLVRQMRITGSIAIGGWHSSGDIFTDPVVFLVPVLFILTCALLAGRLLPLLARLCDRLFSGALPIAPALTLQQLGRRGDVYTNALLLIMTMMAIGVFVASMALSLDGWLGDRIAYRLGSDISFQVDEGPSGLSAGAGALAEGGYVEEIEPSRWLVSLDDLLAIDGVTGATWTGKYRATLPADPTKMTRGWFMAIDRQTLPTAVNFRADYASEPLGSLMNRLAVRPNGVLVSEDYLTRTSMRVGDPLKAWVSTDGANNVELDLVIVGTYRLFPTVYDSQARVASTEDSSSAQTRDEQLDTIIGNLDYLMSMGGGVASYDVWVKAAPTADPEALRRKITEVVPYQSDYLDMWTLTEEEIERKERIGVYGVLSSGFIASLLLAAMGLLVQHRRALEERLWRLAALRAIGLSRGQVRAQVQLEYLLVLLGGLLTGASIGVATAKTFVPYFRVTTEDGLLPLPPLDAKVDVQSMWLMAGAFALTQMVVQGGLLRRALRTDLFQVLRMGARE